MTTPLYVQIKDYIRLNIQSGVFAPDSCIPSERNLARQFGVSRLTVNKAIKELIQEGLLYARVGKGTFVNARTIDQELENLTSFTEEMQRRGQNATSRILYAAVESANAEVAKALNILPGAEVMVLSRVRLADDMPIALETSSVIAALCPGILQRFDFTSESLYRVLRKVYNVHIAYAEQVIEARQATRYEAEALEIDPRAPILQITRVTYSDRPFEYVRSAYRGDRYKFRALLRKIE
jgi:GntR family transcriptional regulator